VAEPGEPPVRVLAAVAPWRTAGAADGQKNLSSGFIKLFCDLRARLRAADDEHGAREKLLQVAIAVGVKLLDMRRKIAAESRDFWRLVKAGRHDDVASLDPLAAFDLDSVTVAFAVALDRNHTRAVADRQRPAPAVRTRPRLRHAA
jgi:hypothetical protein